MSHRGPSIEDGGPVVAYAPSDLELLLLRKRLRQLGLDARVLTSPAPQHQRDVHAYALLANWTAHGIASLRSLAEGCRDLDLVLLVGIARWVPLGTVLDMLAAAGFTPQAAGAIRLGSFRGVELRLTRDEVTEPTVALALLELATWTAPWHRGRQQPARVAVEAQTPYDLRDLPFATDTREAWLASTAAFRLASPEVILVGHRCETACAPGTLEVPADWDALQVARVEIDSNGALQRPTLGAESLLVASYRSTPGPLPLEGPPDAESDVALLEVLASGTATEVPVAHRERLAPEVVAAGSSADLHSTSDVRRNLARSRLRWSVIRHHSLLSLVAALDAQMGQTLVRPPRITLCVDASVIGTSAAHDAAVRMLSMQTREPDELVLLAADDGGLVQGLAASLEAAFGMEAKIIRVGEAREIDGDLIVVVPPKTGLATRALADLELAYQLWSPTVTVIPTEFILEGSGRIHHRVGQGDEGLVLPEGITVAAVAGRELRAHWAPGEPPLHRIEELAAGAVQRGGMIYTMPGSLATVEATPTLLAGAVRLAEDERSALQTYLTRP